MVQLKKFQLAAVKSLFEAMDKPTRDIILKSPTGSGKNNYSYLFYAPVCAILSQYCVCMAHPWQGQFGGTEQRKDG